MNDLRHKASLHIERVYELKRQLGEVEDFQDALEKYDGEEELKIGIPMAGQWYTVELMQDLGITSIQEELIKKLIAELHIRKEVLEMTLNQLIGGNE